MVCAAVPEASAFLKSHQERMCPVDAEGHGLGSSFNETVCSLEKMICGYGFIDMSLVFQRIRRCHQFYHAK